MEDPQYSNQAPRTLGQTTNLTAGGRIPPQAIDLEEAVLVALLIDKNALANIIDILHPEAFYKDQHRNIFNFTIQRTVEQGTYIKTSKSRFY